MKHAAVQLPGRGVSRRFHSEALGLGAWTVQALMSVALMVAPTALAQNGHPPMTVGTPTTDANGVKYYPVTSIYQGSQQIIRVLQPTSPPPGTPPVVLYVLPVDSGVDTLSSTYSDGLEELRLLNVPNLFNMTLIAPSFGYEPWYGDNIRDAKRMESFVVDDLVPFGDTFVPGPIPQRYLIGFSKSGNGALDLILRHPGIFNAVAAWDSPTQLTELSQYPTDLGIDFGTQANFSSYIIPTLVSSNASAFQQQNRIWISGDQALYTAQMQSLDQELTAAGIPHTFVQGGTRAHSWSSGWLIGAATGLNAIATLTQPAAGTLPPPQSGGQPAGVLPATTTQATLSLFTDDNATCRYSTTQGVAYGSMSNTFSSTGATFHSTPVAGLASGNTYSYYVRCQDASGNVNSNDYVIAFTVSSTSTTASSTFSGVEPILSENGLWDTAGAWGAISKNSGAYSVNASAAQVANPLLTPDQFAEITYDHDPGTSGWPGVMTRIQGATNGSGYLAIVYNEQVILYRVDDNGSLSFTILKSANVDAGVAPRDLRLESQGSNHRVIFNGVLLINYTDTNNVYTSGQPGIADATFSYILSFSGGVLLPTPVLSGGQPSGVLPATTTQATLSLTSNENATCRYATTSGMAYGSMVNTFSATGGTTHSTLVTGLVSNTQYSYYVRCQDAAGNADTFDYVIAFTVSSTSTTGSSTFSGVESPLSEGGTWIAPGAWGAMSKDNGASSIGTDAAMMENPLVTPNQFSQITYDHDPGTSGWPGVMTRMQGPANGSGYLAIVYNEQVMLYRVDDTGSLAWNLLATASASAGTAPRQLRLESQGNTHRVIFNGTLLISYTDPNNVYSAGQPGIAAATFSYILSFSGGVLAPAPVLSGGQPAGVLPATTTQTTLSLTTNENATCRYSTTPGVAYASMVNTFSTTGGTAQSTVVTGLVSGTSYSYYVRCQDASGDTDSSDYAIAFTVSSASTTGSSTFTGMESPLSESGTWLTPGAWGAMSKNNGAYSVDTGAAMMENPLVAPTQFSQITYSQDPGTSGWPGVMTRIQGATNGSGYLAIVYSEQVMLYRVDDTGSLAWNLLASASASAGTAPRQLRLESQGNTHRVIFNGTFLISYTDPNNVYSAGQPGIAAATFSYILSFSGGVLVPGPVLSGGQPTGVLPASTTQATLSLTTNENATCRYSTTPGVAYTSMVNTFNTTGGTSQSTLVTGLVSGTNYSYYVRCQDASGNADSYDYTITFSVSGTSTTGSSTFTGVESPLSESGMWITPGDWSAMSKNNGAYSVGTGAAMMVNPLVTPDQFAEITYSQDPGTSGWPGVMTRIQGPTNGSGYLAIIYNEQVMLYRVDDTGSLGWNLLASASVNAGVAPRQLQLQSQGNTHSVYFNGTLVITYTDSNNVYTAGQPGIAAATFSYILSFSGGAL
jgi:hypothetical protein